MTIRPTGAVAAAAVALAAALLGAGCIIGRADAQTPSVAPEIDAAYQAILANPKIIKTLDDIKSDDGTALAEQKRITEIPAPPAHWRALGQVELFSPLAS